LNPKPTSDVILKDRVHFFSKQVVMNKCFLLNPEKKIGSYPSCRFLHKRAFNSEKWRHRAEGWKARLL